MPTKPAKLPTTEDNLDGQVRVGQGKSNVLVLTPGVNPRYVKTKEEQESWDRVQEFHKTLPLFDYGQTPLNDTSIKRMIRPAVELENGTIYEGEWNEKGLRDGRAI